MTEMFCNEPILKVFKLKLKETLQPKWCNSLLQITHKFEYHTTCGLWYLFETENFYITVGYDGVVKYEKPHEFSKENSSAFAIPKTDSVKMLTKIP